MKRKIKNPLTMRIKGVPAVGLEPTYKTAQSRINTMLEHLAFMFRHKIYISIHAVSMT